MEYILLKNFQFAAGVADTGGAPWAANICEFSKKKI